MKFTISLVALFVLALPSAALALNERVTITKTTYLWKDSVELDDGLELMRAGVKDPNVLSKFFSCEATTGSTGIVRQNDSRRGAVRILVLSGAAVGCKGWVTPDAFRID